jgi:hypothetical protein
MTTELKQYIDSLAIQIYRMIDGSTFMAEELDRDTVEGSLVLHRPLQIYQVVLEDTMKTYYVPWMAGSGDHVKVNLDSVIAEGDATFEQKFAYSRYYLLTHLKKYLSPEDYSSAIDEGKEQQQQTSSMPNLPPQLKHTLSKQKRFNLN